MRDTECVTWALHTDRASCLVQRLHSRGTWGMFVCGHIHVCKCRHPCSKKQELLQLRSIKGCICIPRSFVVWPWNMFADTGSVMKVGVGQIQSAENRWKKGLLFVCTGKMAHTSNSHCCRGWWKWLGWISKEKEKQEGIWNKRKNWGLLALHGSKLPGLQHELSMWYCVARIAKASCCFCTTQLCHNGDLRGWIVPLCLWETLKGSVPQIWAQQAAFQTWHSMTFFSHRLGFVLSSLKLLGKQD